MHYVIDFDTSYEIDPFLDWLNPRECKLPIAQTAKWEYPHSYKIILSLQEDKFEKIPDFFECGSLNIVSERLRELLERTVSNIEFVPVKLMCGTQNLNFFALHVMRRIRAIDESRSIFSEKKYNLVTGIDKLVLSSTLIQNEHLFFLDDAYHVVLIVSAYLAERVLSIEATGMRFIAIDQYSAQAHSLARVDTINAT